MTDYERLIDFLKGINVPFEYCPDVYLKRIIIKSTNENGDGQKGRLVYFFSSSGDFRSISFGNLELDNTNSKNFWNIFNKFDATVNVAASILNNYGEYE